VIALWMSSSFTEPRGISIWSVTLMTPISVPAMTSARRLRVQVGIVPEKTAPPFTMMSVRPMPLMLGSRLRAWSTRSRTA